MDRPAEAESEEPHFCADALGEGGNMNSVEWFGGLPGKYHIIIGFLSTIVIGYVDYATGYELRMELFYLFPICYVTWFVGQRIGILFSVLSIISLVYSDFAAGKKYSSFAVEFWNVAMYFVFYVMVTLLLKLRISLQQRENLLEELDNALRQNEELSGMLPICANCKKFRDDQDYRHEVESYMGKHTSREFSQSLCTECAVKLSPRFDKKVDK